MSARKRLIFIATLIMTALFASWIVDLGHATSLNTKFDTKNDRKLAVVNGEVITLADYRIFLLKIDPSLAIREVSAKLLNQQAYGPLSVT